MQYSGGNDDRRHATEIHAEYVQAMKTFGHWLIENGWRIRLFVGDADDQPVAEEIAADLRIYAASLAASTVSIEPVSTAADVARVVQSVSLVVATRFHNVVCAVSLAKPTVSIGYADKSVALMAEAGLPDFSLSARSLEATNIIEKFRELEDCAADLRPKMEVNAKAKSKLLEEQFALLSSRLFQARDYERLETE
jgi:polysaccharide pyruvyl transferase WcaK-like protein